MFQVVLYGLLILVFWTVIASFFELVSFTIIEAIISLAVLCGVTFTVNELLARAFSAPASRTSSIISALILFFLLQPTVDPTSLLGLALAACIIVISKYLIVWKRLHVFNPAALAAVVVGITFISPPIWWIGSPVFFPIVLIVGLLTVKKIRKFDLFLAVIISSSLTAAVHNFIQDVSVIESLYRHFFSWPIIFFATIMVTEPLSTPPRQTQRIFYGIFIGVASSLPLHVGGLYASPELILLIANLYSFSVGLRGRLKISLINVENVGHKIFEYHFKTPRPINFLPGQYLEWILPHNNVDSRGTKRYLTISSVPNEGHISMAVKIPSKASSFKQRLLDLQPGDAMYINQLAGDFILPKTTKSQLVFIAGGIGVTPFCSMIRTALKENKEINAILFYCAKTPEEIAFQDLFEKAISIGLNFVPVITDMNVENWSGESGFITSSMIKNYVEQPEKCVYYLSGPPGMVRAYTTMLKKENVPPTNIHTDFFPGYE